MTQKNPVGRPSKLDDFLCIPVSHAEKVCKDNGLDQVIIIGRKAGEGGFECVTTYGRNKEHCLAAGLIGDFLKFKVMDWDKDGGS